MHPIQFWLREGVCGMINMHDTISLVSIQSRLLPSFSDLLCHARPVDRIYCCRSAGSSSTPPITRSNLDHHGFHLKARQDSPSSDA